MDNLKLQTNVWFVAGWFATTITALIFSLTFTLYLSNTKIIKPSIQSFKLYAALPKSETSITDEINYADGRAKIIEDFFENYKSPLADYGHIFIQVADKYQLDYRLLPSIAMQESNGGRKIIEQSYNPFGYGIYGTMVIKFNSWEDAIESVGKALRENYLNQGLGTPYQIMTKYTPASLIKADGAWAKGVTTFMEELR